MAPALTKRGAALASIGSGLLLTILKLVVGLATGSLAILAEAAHSALDLLAAGITFMVVHIADLPPDENHPYGHARAENLGALAETVLLVVTALWVLRELFTRVFIHTEQPEVNIWALAVLVVSLVVDWRRSRALRRAAAEFKSQAWPPTRPTSATTCSLPASCWPAWCCLPSPSHSRCCRSGCC